MKTRHAIIVALAAATTAVGGATVVQHAVAGESRSTQAQDACYEVIITGTLTGYQQVGPFCRPTPPALICQNPTASATPFVAVWTEVCV